jgi:hypothetical protein
MGITSAAGKLWMKCTTLSSKDVETHVSRSDLLSARVVILTRYRRNNA